MEFSLWKKINRKNWEIHLVDFLGGLTRGHTPGEFSSRILQVLVLVTQMNCLKEILKFIKSYLVKATFKGTSFSVTADLERQPKTNKNGKMVN